MKKFIFGLMAIAVFTFTSCTKEAVTGLNPGEAYGYGRPSGDYDIPGDRNGDGHTDTDLYCDALTSTEIQVAFNHVVGSDPVLYTISNVPTTVAVPVADPYHPGQMTSITKVYNWKITSVRNIR